ncbi:MAG TPA: Rne/Rng family ribonuclease [Blastocatellia bacterium]|nr:Rne/Rng family ribonuclease [Blastocatellia bacterium]
MAKELIISANVHEKKVAIVEDGLVTEFYVERRDENQGVVGNLYKGRVMKVLPGMQSAFVDIGLDRDAFLYVSDFTEFLEEEDEIDFKPGDELLPQQPAERPDDRGRRDPRRRPEPIVAGGGPAPGRPREAELGTAERTVRIEDAVEQLAEIATEKLIPPPPADEPGEPRAEALGTQVQPFEDVVVERVTDEPLEEADVRVSEVSADETATAEEVEERPRRGRARKKAGEPEPGEASTRSKRKTAKIDEKASTRSPRSTSKKPAAKPASKRAGKGGSEEFEEPDNGTFERVTDDDRAQDAGDLLKDAILQEKFIEQIHNAEYDTGAGSIKREPEPEPEWRVGSLRSQVEADSEFQRVIDESERAAQESSRNDSDAGPVADQSFHHVSDALPTSMYDRIQAEVARPPSEEFYDEPTTAMSAGDAAPSAFETEDSLEDREAEVRDRNHRAEFAARRGGRGRRGRRSGQKPPVAAPVDETQAAPVQAAGEPEAVVEHGQLVEEAAGVSEETPAEAQPMPAQPVTTPPIPGPQPVGAQSGPPRPSGPRPQGRPERRPDQRRPEQRRQDALPSRRPERSGPPTISDLLHEGQEILVQIAKEPIAKKGARITSHIALPGRLLVYMPTVNHIGVSRKIPSDAERVRLKRIVTSLREREGGPGGFIARTACAGHSEQELHDDMRYLLRTWGDVRKKVERVKAPALAHRDLDLVQRILRDQLSDDFSAIRIDNEVEYARIVEFVNRVQPRLVKRVKLYTGDQPILEKYGVQAEIDKAVRPRVWLKSGGYIVINQTEALVAIDVNTGKFVGKSDRLEDTITRTNLEAAKEIVRQIRLRDLGGIIVLDLIDMDERKNRQKVMMALQQELATDRAPSKILSINDFGLVAITRKRVKQSLERTLCSPCPYCQGAGMVKSAQTMCFEILEQAKGMSKQLRGANDVMLRVSPHVAEAFRKTERAVLEEIEAYFATPVTIEADPNLHQEQFDFAVV